MHRRCSGDTSVSRTSGRVRVEKTRRKGTDPCRLNENFAGKVLVHTTENVDPPDMKIGGLGTVFHLTRSQGQISTSPERSTLSFG